MNKLLQEIKDNDEDFEWYPTTNEIIERLYYDIINADRETNFTLLDIGAGNGKVFSKLEELNKRDRDRVKNSETNFNKKRNIEGFSIGKYAIEKSSKLIETYPDDIFIIGTDFYQQSLIDKNIDTTFCNPPYSDYITWTNKILMESNSNIIYLVIPKRWEDNKQIQQTITLRDYKYEILGTYDFKNSEDRKARAEVNLIKFYQYKYSKTDPFTIWFDSTFEIKADKDRYGLESKENNKKQEKINEIMNTDNFIEELVLLYKRELDKLANTYKQLENLDYEILKELNVNLPEIREGLKTKIEGLKNLYWKTLFDRLSAITERLTKGSRDKLLSVLFRNVSVDFSESNIYAIVIWTIKNANKYIDKQLLEVYYRLSDIQNIKLYKSNKRVIEDSWRYMKSEMSHYSLDYRIVTSGYNNFNGYSYDKINGLGETAYQLIKDVLIIGINLGFNIDLSDLDKIQWISGSKVAIYYKQNGESVLFCDIKCFMNNNIHFRFTPEFMKKLNIEASRLNGWIKSPKEAVDEFDITEEEAENYFKSNNLIDLKNSNVKLLTF